MPLLPQLAVADAVAAVAVVVRLVVAAVEATLVVVKLLAIFLSLMELVGVEATLAAAAAADVDADDDESLLLVLLTTSWTTLDEALRCLSPLILTISSF